MAKALVEHPEQVSVSEKYVGNTTILELRVAPSDMGKVIGKQGRIAKAMRTVIKAQAMKPVSYTHLDVYKRQGPTL